MVSTRVDRVRADVADFDFDDDYDSRMMRMMMTMESPSRSVSSTSTMSAIAHELSNEIRAIDIAFARQCAFARAENAKETDKAPRDATRRRARARGKRSHPGECANARALKRVAFEGLKRVWEIARAHSRACDRAFEMRTEPTKRAAFDALRANADRGKPRREAVRHASEVVEEMTRRRTMRACVRAWRRAAREGTMERASAAIHGVRVAEAALRHWELFATERFWKRRAIALAIRFRARRMTVRAFCGWLRDARRAKERRVAVRAKLFGMSVTECQRAVHGELRYTARDATKKLESEMAYVYKECLESSMRSQVASSKKLASTLRSALRFSASDEDVVWASSGAAEILGIGASFRHLALDFDVAPNITRVARTNARFEEISRNRTDAMTSRLAAEIEDVVEEDDAPARGNIDVLSAEAYEVTREHQRALTMARDAAQKCVAARAAAHEASLNASRLVSNAEARANAALQGASDAMEDSLNAEYRAMEADEAANIAEKRADEIAEAWGARDEGKLAEALRRAAEAATRALAFSSAHAAAARVAERAAEIAEDHKQAAVLIKAQAKEDVEAARTCVVAAEAAVLATAQAERELKTKATNAMRQLNALTLNASSKGLVVDKNGSFERDVRKNAVYSPQKARKLEEKEAMQQRLTWASYGVDDEDEDEAIDVCKVSMKPGGWHTLNDAAVHVYGRRILRKALCGFTQNVKWCKKQRDAARLALVTNVFNAWASTTRAILTRRKRVERIVDEINGEDRERRMRLYLMCFQRHAVWRRARCEELTISLRRVAIATIRDDFNHWVAKVHRIKLFRRVINRAVLAWRDRLAKPSHVGAFDRLFDSLAAWRRFAAAARARRENANAAIEYHRVTLSFKSVRAWRGVTRQIRRARCAQQRALEDFVLSRRRRTQTFILVAWRRQTLERRARALSIEIYYRRIARRALAHWRDVTARSTSRLGPRLFEPAPLAETVFHRHWRRLSAI